MIAAFYSYKGGVGRTQALVGLGLELVRRDKRVCLVDVDVEAPGVHHLLKLEPNKHESLLEHLISQDTNLLPTRVIEINTLFGRPLAELLGKSAHGALFVLPSLPDRTKLDKLAQLDSVRFFIDSLAYLVDKLALDYVLLDSRTGFARVAPLALRSADLFVLVTRLDAQNASGIRDLLQITRRKPTILLASMVPDPDLDVPASMREARLREFEATTGGKIDVVVPFDKRLLFGDLIPAVHFDADSPVCTAIRELAELILEMRS